MSAAGFFNILDRVDSTNNYAMAKLHAGMANHGMAWFTNEQTAGKGQRGKTWLTEKGKNIVMSLVIEPEPLYTKQPFLLSATVAWACFEFFKAYAGEETKIKWPNDLFWRDRKAGGVLIENIYHGKIWKWAVIGIGININQTSFNKNLSYPVSLKQITGKDFDTIVMAKELYAGLMKKITGQDANSVEKTMENYNDQLYKLNRKVIFEKEDVKFETVIKGVSNEGRLLTVDAIERAFDFGEVEWVL